MPKPTQLTPEEIRAAMDRGNSIPHVSTLIIDWNRTNSDKRAGTIYAWTIERKFLGQFRHHANAIDAGAAFTKLNNFWFDWRTHVKVATTA